MSKKSILHLKILLTLLMAIVYTNTYSQTLYNVTIRNSVIPPASRYFDQMLQQISHGKLMVTVAGGDPAGGQKRVKLAGTLECLSPTPFTISLNKNFQPQQPIFLALGNPVTLNGFQLMQAFGNLVESNLQIQGTSFNTLKKGVNLNLPEGTYRICFVAYDYNDANYALPLSNPATGCATFRICYSASAPQFLQPVNSNNMVGSIPIVAPKSPMIFTWTRPNSTCGVAMPPMYYDFEIHELFQGQAPSDAIYNPPVFMKNNLPSTTFLLDTMLYRNVLKIGKQYVMRVHVRNAPGMAGATDTVNFQNFGFSRVEPFQYGRVVNRPSNPKDTISVVPNKPIVVKKPADTTGNVSKNNPITPSQLLKNSIDTSQKSDTTAKASSDTTKVDSSIIATNAFDSTANCGLNYTKDSTVVDKDKDLKNDTISIGEFKLIPTSITRDNADSTYSGTGTIDWKPYLSTIKLAVTFKKIKINDSLKVFSGVVTSATDPQKFQLKSFATWNDITKQTGQQLDQLSSGVENFINSNKTTNVISQIVGKTPVNCPIGLDNENFGGTPTTIAIMSMTFSPKGATMSVLMSLNIPEANGWLSLAGTGFCMNPTGVSFKQGTLMLPSDRYFNLGTAEDSLVVKFKGSPSADSSKGTYVSWTKDSISAVVVHAEITLPKNAVVREDSTGSPVDSAVVAGLMFRFHKWDDWIAMITTPNFQINGVKGLTFSSDTIYYDHSSKQNVKGFNFPKEYTGYKGADFEGLYIPKLMVLLPSDFKTFNQGKDRTAFGAKDFILDDKGVSTHILGTKIIDLNNGDLGGWGYSLDTVEVVIQQNTFQSGRLNGQVLMPISKTPLEYSADLHKAKDSSLQYEFVIQPKDSMVIDLWAATMTLNKNSAFTVKKDSLGTAVTFILNGTLGISTGGGGSPSSVIPGLKFDSLGIGNRDPSSHAKKFWFNKGDWSFGDGSDKNSKTTSYFNWPQTEDGLLAGGPNFNGENIQASYSENPSGNSGDSQSSVGGFPISINNIGPLVDLSDPANIKLGIKFDLNVNIGFGDASVISATTKLGIYGKINASFENMAPQITLSAGVDIDSVQIKGGVGPVSVDGMLVFYNHDQTYGDGLKGHVKATFPLVTVEATAQFGNVNNYNYWYIDACATFPTIPVVGPIGINGFGGGAYYNMAMSNNLPADPASLTASSNANDATAGHTMSGVTFTPQEGTAGIRATVCVAMVSGAGADAMNAKVTLTAQIKNGAFDMLNLHGDVFVLTNFPSNSNATINGTVDITYDFAQNKFSLDADVQGKFATITADIPIGIYAGPDGWFFKVGDAFAKRVSINLVDITNDVFTLHLGATAYFEMGSLINPQLPDLPTQITSHGLTRSSSASALIDAMNQSPGDGMMFGAEVDGKLKFSFAMLYANADAIVGFDMILKHFDQEFQCNSQAAGWQNWYALGQLYAYLGVDVGIHVDVWFAHGDFSLCKLEVSALLTGGLPDPTWLDGDLQVDGEVLDGLISVHTTAHFTVGDKCYPNPDPLKDVQIISDYGPKGKADVFDNPYVASNVGLETNYNIDVPPTKDKPNGETRTFRFSIESFTISSKTQPNVYAHQEFQNGNTVSVFALKDMLLPNTTYNVNVVCNAMQFYPDENRWDFPYNDNDQQREQVEQTTTFSFTTGPAPDYVPEKNVHFSYPINHQRYVLKQEASGKGALQLSKWQNNIFPDKGGSLLSSRIYNLYFIDHATNDTVKTTYTNDNSTNTINYSLPANLKNNTVYRMDFYSIPNGKASPKMVKSLVSMSTRTSGNVSYQVKQTSVSGKFTNASSTALASSPTYLVYTMYMRTSQYNTFNDKMNALGNWNGNRGNNYNVYISNDGSKQEGFDQFEIKGYTSPDGTYYPSLFSAGIDWNSSQQNDQFAEINLYGNALSLAFKSVSTNLGVPELREMIYKPAKTLDWSQFPADAPLSVAETGEVSKYAVLNKSNTVAMSMHASSTPQITSVTRSGLTMSLSPKLGLKQNSSMTMQTFQTSYQLTWSRDYYIRQDYNLMNTFGLTAQTQASIIQHQLDPGGQESTLSQMDGVVTFATNAIGGTISMPWNKFYYLYTDPNSMNILNKLRYLSFTPIASGSRTIHFQYKAGSMPGSTVSKTFTIK